MSFNNDNNHNAKLAQMQQAVQQSGLGAQLQYQNDPYSGLRKQLDEALANGSKLNEQLYNSNIKCLELEVQVATLKLQLAKAVK